MSDKKCGTCRFSSGDGKDYYCGIVGQRVYEPCPAFDDGKFREAVSKLVGENNYVRDQIDRVGEGLPTDHWDEWGDALAAAEKFLRERP